MNAASSDPLQKCAFPAAGLRVSATGPPNGYPGPIHAIELAGRLGLAADQVVKLQAAFEAMKAEAIPLGATLISQERNLNDDFAKRTVTPASLETTTQQIGATQAALRAAHLKYHITTVAILTPDQVQPQELIRMEIEKPTGGSIYLWGEVVYQVSEMGFALRFTGTSDQEEAMLNLLIEYVREAQAELQVSV